MQASLVMTGGYLTWGCNGAESLFHPLQQADKPTFLLRAAEQATGDCIFHCPPSLIHLTLAVSVCICFFSEIYDSTARLYGQEFICSTDSASFQVHDLSSKNGLTLTGSPGGSSRWSSVYW